jgi:hypothetical protein
MVVLLYSCGPNTNEKAGNADTASATTQTSSLTSGNYFHLLKGSIGSYPVTLYLFAQQHQYSGYYYYDRQQKPIYLYGNDTAQDTQIRHRLQRTG